MSPLRIICRNCGYLILDLSETSDIFDFLKDDWQSKIVNECPKCNVTLEKFNPKINVFPLYNKRRNNTKRKYPRIYQYVYNQTWRNTFCRKCGEPLRTGEVVVSVRSRGKRRVYHEKCIPKTW